MRDRFAEVWHNWQGAGWKLFLVFAIGWSFVNAVQLAMRLIESGEDRGHGDDPRPTLEPPPDDGEKIDPAKIKAWMIDWLNEEVDADVLTAERESLTTEG